MTALYKSYINVLNMLYRLEVINSQRLVDNHHLQLLTIFNSEFTYIVLFIIIIILQFNYPYFIIHNFTAKLIIYLSIYINIL